jgi:hypothetical protein
MMAILSVLVFFVFNIWNMNTAAHSPEELKLSIRTQKSTYAVGEAVYLEIGLRNTGTTPIKVLKYFRLPADDPSKNNLEIQVYDAGGNPLSRVSHVLTGRALYYPETRVIKPEESYGESIQLTGTFNRRSGDKTVSQAIWIFGENPEITSVNEYPLMTRGTFKVKIVYHVYAKQLANLGEAEGSTVWIGESISNTIEITVD